jgi:hypothetical protein
VIRQQADLPKSVSACGQQFLQITALSSQPFVSHQDEGVLGKTVVRQMSGNAGGFYRSVQHHLGDLLHQDGVYERRKTIKTFSHAEDGDLERLEGGAVVA